MRLQITQMTLRWTQRVLFASALSMLSYCGFVLGDAWLFQNKESRQFDRLISKTSGATSTAKVPPPPSGELIGRLEIARLGVSLIIIEGTSRTVLRRGVGHISGTALPGHTGNVGISGHRDTFFRPLRNIRQNDIVTLITLLGEYRYRVLSTRVVSPHDVTVLDPDGNEILTLITCYPFYFVGAAPERFIVRAQRVT